MLEEEEEYDSTWAESEEESGPPPSPARLREPQEKGGSALETVEDQEKTRSNLRLRYPDYDKPRRRSKRAAMDLQRYRHHYPDLKDNTEHSSNVNLMFYLGKACSQPNGCKITEMLKWKGKYDHLERNHSYIQWLFPLREPGMNWWAKELTVQEIKSFEQTIIAKTRLVEAYKMMLDFYGIMLVNEETGEVKRAPHWEQRFHNLNQHSHNNLRITRILKCLGELGFGHYQEPLVKFFLVETLIHKRLPQVKDSVLDYFLFTIRNKAQRRKLILFAQQHYQPLSDFVWGPPKGTEDRFRYIQEELKKEVFEHQIEEGSGEDISTKIGDAPSEAGREEALKKGESCPDSSADSGNFMKDTEQRSEDLVKARSDVDSSQEQCSAEEKASSNRKPPVSESTEEQTEDQEEAIAEDDKPTAISKDCKNRLGQKSEDTSGLSVTPVVASESNGEQIKKLKGNSLPSDEHNLVTVGEKTTIEGLGGKNATGLEAGTDRIEPDVTEHNRPVTERNQTGIGAQMGERAVLTPSTSGEERPTKEDAERKNETVDQTACTESVGNDTLTQNVIETDIQSPAKDEINYVEEMETQEASSTDDFQEEKDTAMEEN
ncbi:opioid growth factor receptor-like isoform X2 [Hypanus sabinus]|uniref:opioid growth factor receptor-like isoform X2 n=1 Tax=Hypanus sabinus TaxID=79690 RepID=UPI0028C49271|nr:opioid growth factor receptor-like isoform X2 [Hypanus sabinus]